MIFSKKTKCVAIDLYEPVIIIISLSQLLLHFIYFLLKTFRLTEVTIQAAMLCPCSTRGQPSLMIVSRSQLLLRLPFVYHKSEICDMRFFFLIRKVNAFY